MSPVSLPVPRQPPGGTQRGLRAQCLLSADLGQAAVPRGLGGGEGANKEDTSPWGRGQGTPPCRCLESTLHAHPPPAGVPHLPVTVSVILAAG